MPLSAAGARYYSQVQCGARVDPSLYQARGRHAACQADARDVRARIDEEAIWAQLRAPAHRPW